MQNSTVSSESQQAVSNSTLGKLSDKELYQKCKYYGAAARSWRQKFIGLLPEVNRRRLYEKKGFLSIFEFAAKLCGLSKEQVYLVLNLEKRFEDKVNGEARDGDLGHKPVLKKMLENGEASINKLARVVSIATPENEEELAEKVKVLSQSALETFVRDEKCAQQDAENANGLLEPLFDDKSLRAQTLNFEIDDDVKQQLNELNSKGIDVNKLLREMLKKRQEKIAETIQPTTSHYISTRIRGVLKEEHGKKCSISTCKKPATIIHHTQRFGLSRNHDPRFLAPLCREHHIIAHSMDFKYQIARGSHF